MVLRRWRRFIWLSASSVDLVTIIDLVRVGAFWVLSCLFDGVVVVGFAGFPFFTTVTHGAGGAGGPHPVVYGGSFVVGVGGGGGRVPGGPLGAFAFAFAFPPACGSLVASGFPVCCCRLGAVLKVLWMLSTFPITTLLCAAIALFIWSPMFVTSFFRFSISSAIVWFCSIRGSFPLVWLVGCAFRWWGFP